jgi:hypothetical protein
MNTTLAVVVSAIVILITALVVITIFGNSMGNVGSIAEAKSLCMSTYATSCAATGSSPTVWAVSVNGVRTQCLDTLVRGCSCQNRVAVGCLPV